MAKPTPPKRRNTALAAHLARRSTGAGGHANPLKRAKALPRKRKHKGRL
jgi:hypothetical protein